MLAEIQQLLSDDWLLSQRKIPHPTSPEFSEVMEGKPDPRGEMEARFARNCDETATRLERASSLAIEEPERSIVAEAKANIEKQIYWQNYHVAEHDSRLSGTEQPSLTHTYVWFYKVDQFERNVAALLRQASERLEAAKRDTVAKL